MAWILTSKLGHSESSKCSAFSFWTPTGLSWSLETYRYFLQSSAWNWRFKNDCYSCQNCLRSREGTPKWCVECCCCHPGRSAFPSVEQHGLLRVEALASDRASLKACRTVLWAKLCDENWWRKNTATPHLLWKYQEIWAWACPISMTIASNAATRCWQVAGMWIFIPYPTKFQELVKHFFLKKCKPSCIFQSWWRL